MTVAERLLELAKERGALKLGEFTLTCGEISRYYFDGRLLTLDPEGAHLISSALIPILKEARVQAVGGPTIGADPIVAAVSLGSYHEGSLIPGFMVRKEAKSHGTMQQIEGPLRPGSRVAIVDDVCTTGSSLFYAIQAVEAVDCVVAKVITVLDRNQGGSDELRRRGYEFGSLLEASPEGDVRVTPGIS